MSLSIISGIALAVLGILLAKPILHLMEAPSNVLDLSALYLRIYFLGMPAMMLYNFGSAILRGKGRHKETFKIPYGSRRPERLPQPVFRHRA